MAREGGERERERERERKRKRKREEGVTDGANNPLCIISENLPGMAL